jgi:ABC-type sugar transport system permease subunit
MLKTAPGGSAAAMSAAAAGPLSARERFARWRYRNRHPFEGWLILAPILTYYSVFFFIPVISSLLLSFTKWSGLSGTPEWVGLANYQRFINDAMYRQVLGNTILFAVLTLVLQTALGFVIALMLNTKVKGRGLYRAAWYIPTLTAAAVMAQVAFVFISPTDGVINTLLRGLGHPGIIFYMQVDWMRGIIIAYSVWRGVGGPMILYLAGLQGIHPELYEAAQVDGASGWQLLRYITLPLLAPMTIFVLVTGIIGTAQVFEAVMFLSKGGPGNQTNVIMLQIYQDAFANASIGMASAGAMFLGLILLAFSIFNIRIMSRGRVGE